LIGARLTSDRAAILEAYFALFREQEPTTIGSGEIVRWFRAQGRTAPSESLIRTVLAAVGVPCYRAGWLRGMRPDSLRATVDLSWVCRDREGPSRECRSAVTAARAILA
jgi:hypothetical protein